jgi:choline dehydrogenase-like flavoprotein
MPLNHLLDSGRAIQPPPDVQRTTLGLDVLSRYVCNTWDEATANSHFDAVVIGAGMFGGYCAEKIYRFGAANGLRVLLLEAGPFVIPTHLQNLPRIGLNVPNALYPGADPGVARELVWGIPWRSNVDFVGQAYCVGGKSLYWGGWCPRLLASDLANWPPTVAQYIAQNYPLLERQTGVDVRTDFIQGPLFSLLKARAQAAQAAVPQLDTVEDPPLAVQGQSPASGIFSFDKYSSVTLLIDALREAAGTSDAQRRLFLVPNTHVSRLDVANGVVTGIVARHDGRDRYLGVAPSCAVILALGAIESTRLALVSFPRTADASQELMGRNLMLHIRTNTYARLRRAALDPTHTLPAQLQAAALLARGSSPNGQFHLQITASADAGFNSDALLYSMIPDIDQLDALLQIQQADWISVAVRAVGETFGDQGTPVPNAGGRWINLSPFERDEYGVPRAYVQLTTTAAEDAVAQAMDSATIKLLRAMVNGNQGDVEILNQTRDGLGTTYHEAGTLWMGTSAQSSVTNPNGRFHHVGNAFCADQALFPTVGTVNPTLTGLVLARRVAQAAVAHATGAPLLP